MPDGKPPYRIPTMAEVQAIPFNGLRLVSTFSGAGGSSLGYRMAGYKVLWANEFVEAARETYRANFPETILDPRDVREVSGREILEAAGLDAGELDVLDGSPPCVPFSTSGRREKKWGKVTTYSDAQQRTDDLFFEFVRLLSEIRPRAFVAENVAGLIVGASKGYFIEILRALRDCGYTVEARLLDAARLGVPQVRKRLIFVGVRADLRADPPFPSPLAHSYTVRDALPDLAPRAARAPGARARRRVVFDQQTTNKQFEQIWVPLDRPSPTITTYPSKTSGFLRSSATGRSRPYTIPELRALCSFPADFVLTGSEAQQWERLGRAVPPFMMRAVASEIARNVFGVEARP